MSLIDLHIHTSASDGDFSPKQIVDLAIEKNMEVIAITDHDTLSGINEAQLYSFDKNIKIIPGIEITCEEGELKDVHILGLFVNPENTELITLVKKVRQESIKQKEKIIENLNNLGFKITIEEIKKDFGDSISRPQIAKTLIKKYPEKFKEVMQVFHELIGKGKPAYAEQKQATIKEAIESILVSGGISILAHPGIYGNESIKLIETFISHGGNGIETDYPYEIVPGITKEFGNKMNEKFKEIARNKSLLMSGGSDFHGSSMRAVEIGDRGIEKEEFKKLLELVKK